MSQENLEIVRGAHAEFERGNFWLPEIFDPSVRVVWLPVAGGEQETVGLDGMARVMKDWIESWEQVTTVAEQKRANIQLREGTTKQEYANIRKTRDAQLDMPALILPAIQINIRAGEFPMPEANGTAYLKIPLNRF